MADINDKLNIQNHSSSIHLPGEGILYYYFADGTITDDLKLNWFSCPIHQLVMLELHIRGRKFRIRRQDHKNLIEFVQFKTAISRPGKTQCVSRSIGYTDGKHEYMFEINIDTFEVRQKLYKKRIHLHPLSFGMVDFKKGILEN